MLEALGLTADAEAVYRTMLAQPLWDTDQLAAHAGISPDRVEDVWHELATANLLRRSWQHNGAYLPVSPSIGLTSLLATAEAEADRRRAALEAARSAVTELADGPGVGRRCDGGIRLAGDALQLRLAELADRARVEWLALEPSGGCLAAPDVHLAGDVELRRVVDALAPPGRDRRLRVFPRLPHGLVVVDRSVALVLPDDEPGGTVLELHNTGAVTVARALFEQVWAVAQPLDGAPHPDDDVTGIERQVLQLLALGHTDEAVARRLGCSLRTVRRITADLMQRLEARSRFQAGAYATKRGWVCS